jgi:hypothetical protein
VLQTLLGSPDEGQRRAGHAERIDKQICSKVWLQNLNGRDYLEAPGVHGRLIFEPALNKWFECVWISGQGSSCGRSNEPQGSVTGRGNCRPFMKRSAAESRCG